MARFPPDGSFANLAGVDVGAPGEDPGEGAATQVLVGGVASVPTSKTQTGSLITLYELPEGLTVRQELALVPGEGGADALEINYLVENASGEDRSVSLASLLAPALFVGPPGAMNGSPFVSGTLAEEGADPAIRTERDLFLEKGEDAGRGAGGRISAGSAVPSSCLAHGTACRSPPKSAVSRRLARRGRPS